MTVSVGPLRWDACRHSALTRNHQDGQLSPSIIFASRAKAPRPRDA